MHARSEAARSQMPVNKDRPRYIHGSSSEVWEFPGKRFVQCGEIWDIRREPCLSAACLATVYLPELQVESPGNGYVEARMPISLKGSNAKKWAMHQEKPQLLASASSGLVSTSESKLLINLYYPR